MVEVNGISCEDWVTADAIIIEACCCSTVLLQEVKLKPHIAVLVFLHMMKYSISLQIVNIGALSVDVGSVDKVFSLCFFTDSAPNRRNSQSLYCNS